jgi:hypothetical protein
MFSFFVVPLNRAEGKESPEACLDFLANFVDVAVVMLGSKGCIARRGEEVSLFFNVQLDRHYEYKAIVEYRPYVGFREDYPVQGDRLLMLSKLL